jgi:S-layer homology domain
VARLVAFALILFAAVLPPGGTFVDDDGIVHEGSIEAIAAADITRGCNPPANDRFCPDLAVERGAMAAFLTRALGLPSTSEDFFDDDAGHLFEADINRLAAAGITRGCNPPANTRFCPDEAMTRGEMAALLARAFGYPASALDRFEDDDDSTFEGDIQKIAAVGVTVGCNPPANTRFCPDDEVTRAEMATFLTRALHLTPNTPPARCPTLPADDTWNTRVDHLPVHARSAQFVSAIGSTSTVHADFGSGVWPPGSTSPIGIPYLEVGPGEPLVTITYDAYGSESDPGPFPIPIDAPIEGGPASSGDRHVIVVDRYRCELFELFDASPGPGNGWTAASGARYDLDSSALRPDGWTSADAAGLPIFPGLVRYDEVRSGVIAHAIRFTAPQTRNTHVWPARHDASSSTSTSLPPMGQRFRLAAGYDISGYSKDVRVILTAMKRYGLILADNGSPWYLSGAPDPRWDNDVLHELGDVPGSAFEAVDTSGMIVNVNSGQAVQP